MNQGQMLYFSPSIRFTELAGWGREASVRALGDRLEGFFLDPMREVNEKKFAFAAGLLAVTAIDFLGRIAYGGSTGHRFTTWVEKHLLSECRNDLPISAAQQFYDDFRNGLVHEGRIKNGGQFTYDFTSDMRLLENTVLIVNPGFLYQAIQRFVKNYLETVRDNADAWNKLRCRLQDDFSTDLSLAIRLK